MKKLWMMVCVLPLLCACSSNDLSGNEQGSVTQSEVNALSTVEKFEIKKN